VQRAQRQAQATAKAEAQPARLRQMKTAVGVLLIAGLTTLLLSGFIASVQAGLLVFGIVAVILLLRSLLLPLCGSWNAWARYLSEVPMILRLAYSSNLAYQLTQLALSYLPRRACSCNPAQAIEHFAQAIGALSSIFGQQRQVRSDKGPFVVAHISRVGSS
jgi:predicted lipid-binding transport protein (Tim44 family)